MRDKASWQARWRQPKNRLALEETDGIETGKIGR
jgi:hypothetical protein